MAKSETDKHVRTAQIEQTQSDIIQAMLQMMHTQSFDSLKISAVMNKAGYSRRTFYRHFDSLEAVLRAYLDNLVLELYNFLNQKNSTSFSQAVYWFFVYWQQQRDFLILLKQNQRLSLIGQTMTQRIEQNPLAKSDLKQLSYAQQFAIGGMSQMLICWLEQGCKEEPAQMVRVAQGIIHHLG